MRPISFLIPLRGRIWQRAYYGAGVLLYDLMAFARGKKFPRHRHLSRKKALELVPGLQRSSLIGGILYYDAQIDDARHTVAVGRTAAHHGAAIATSTRVESLLKDGDRVVGAAVRDIEGNETYEIRAKRIINATGVWIDDIQDMAGPAGLRVHAAKGVHIVLPRSGSRATAASFFAHRHRSSSSSRGDIGCSAPPTPRGSRPGSPGRFIEGHRLPARAGERSAPDTTHPHRCRRRLRRSSSPHRGEGDDTTQFSREHAIAQPTDGLISIAGAKYTTYRVMAADAVDAAVADLDRPVAGSNTDEVLLIGETRGAAPGARRSTRS